MFPSVTALPPAWKNRKSGQKFWIYNQTGMGSLEYPATVPRLFYWFAFQNRLDGMLYWCVNQLSKTTYLNGAYRIGSTEFTWFYPDQSNPRIIYPSLRLLLAREGLDDYEYLKALNDAGIDPAEFRTFSRHCHLDPRTGTMVYHTKSNYELQKDREKIIRLLERSR